MGSKQGVVVVIGVAESGVAPGFAANALLTADGDPKLIAEVDMFERRGPVIELCGVNGRPVFGKS